MENLLKKIAKVIQYKNNNEKKLKTSFEYKLVFFKCYLFKYYLLILFFILFLLIYFP